ncbi:EF-hand domain-containing protein [Sphingomonas aracearum]|uniref:EF-hand domain-containing protein n=1 Tax=Sphingomonas aracearum TaxID=2283317 RepID=A0A369VYQ4_9SPHN|nr:EF-hand domain-containing protein [Sphingomonas aracearum]RDE06949.1 EF-hand domain-containing protein [Sphingomonas aracearum]
MLKYVLLAGAMTVAAPALAQSQTPGGSAGATTAAPQQQGTPGRAPIGGDSAPPAPDSATAPTQQVPANPATGATPASPSAATDNAQTTDTPSSSGATTGATPGSPQSSAAPVNKADQVAQVVQAEFPSYDKDGNGSLSSTEFGAWMVALKSASDPNAKADDPATRTWAGQAFAQADKDKSKSVSKTELQGFLSQAG